MFFFNPCTVDSATPMVPEINIPTHPSFSPCQQASRLKPPLSPKSPPPSLFLLLWILENSLSFFLSSSSGLYTRFCVPPWWIMEEVGYHSLQLSGKSLNTKLLFTNTWFQACLSLLIFSILSEGAWILPSPPSSSSTKLLNTVYTFSLSFIYHVFFSVIQ